jgi:glycosyltransferase involved in cell wall biosynthesis
MRSIGNTFFYILGLLARCRRYDVLHVFSASYWSFLMSPTPAILLGKLLRKRVILNYHSGEAEDHLKNWRSALPIVKLADEVIVPSEYLVKVFANFGVSARSIFNTVDTRRFVFRERREPRPMFLSNRNLEPLYNVGCAIRAFGLVQAAYPDASLRVIGDGAERLQLEELVRTMGLRNVRFDGRIPHADMARAYDEADIYLNTPNIDNMPLSIIEAFAAGIPVVTTDAGGIPYIVSDGKTGLIAPRNDPARLAEHAKRLLAEPGLAARITREARRECARYSWPAVRGQWLAAYKDPIGTNHK